MCASLLGGESAVLFHLKWTVSRAWVYHLNIKELKKTVLCFKWKFHTPGTALSSCRSVGVCVLDVVVDIDAMC